MIPVATERKILRLWFRQGIRSLRIVAARAHCARDTARRVIECGGVRPRRGVTVPPPSPFDVTQKGTCPTCGASVFLPCFKCYIEGLGKEKSAAATVAPDPAPNIHHPAGLDLRPDDRRRYAELFARKFCER